MAGSSSRILADAHIPHLAFRKAVVGNRQENVFSTNLRTRAGRMSRRLGADLNFTRLVLDYAQLPKQTGYNQSSDSGLDGGRRFHNHLELMGFLGHLRELSRRMVL